MSDHLLSKYWQSLLTIVLNQFRCKRVRGGMQGVVRMAEENAALRQLFEEQRGMELGEMRRVRPLLGLTLSMVRVQDEALHCLWPLPGASDYLQTV